MRYSWEEDGNTQYYHGIHEVFYNDKDEITAYSVKAVPVEGETEEAILDQLSMLNTALNEPVLDIHEVDKRLALVTEQESRDIDEGH